MLGNFFKRFSGDANKLELPDSITPELAKRFADRFNLEYIPGKTGKEDDSIIIPKGFGDLVGDKHTMRSFLEFWTDNGSEITDIENARMQKYAIYDSMDATMTEAIITLDTYADEALSVGFLDHPVEITFRDKQLQKKVLDILKKSAILENSRADIRNLCKYGDLGYQILVPEDGNKNNITIKPLVPKDWKAIVAKGIRQPIGYQILTAEFYPPEIMKKLQMDKTIPPWLFIQSTIANLDTRPYGRSLLEGMRVVFDQLMTIEGLLALSRASKVERLVVKIPTGNNNPTHAMSKLNQFKSQWKNVIFQDNTSGSVKSKGKIAALTEILFMPSIDGFAIDKIQSNIDISSVDDVEYFRDKAIVATRMPKGYFVTDSGGGLGDQGGALRAQDLKFARSLVPYERGYATGMTKLCMCLAGILDPMADLANLGLKVKVKRPPQVAAELLEIYSDIFENVGKMIDTFRKSNQTDEGKDPIVPKGLFQALLKQLGLPNHLCKMFSPENLKDPKPEAPYSDGDQPKDNDKDSPNKDGLYSTEGSENYYSVVDSSDVYREHFQGFFEKGDNKEKMVTLIESLHEEIDDL